MGRGTRLPPVRFDTELRSELSRILRGRDVSVIIADLEGVVQVLPAFQRSPRRQSARDTLQNLRKAAAELRSLLEQLADDEDVKDHLHSALILLRPDATQPLVGLDERLDVLDDAIDRCMEMLRRQSKGGRPRDRDAFWLVEQVADALKRHGVTITTSEDGIYAQVVRELWRYVRPKSEAPQELKPWFKLLKSQR